MDVKRIRAQQQSNNSEMKGIPLRSFAFANKGVSSGTVRPVLVLVVCLLSLLLLVTIFEARWVPSMPVWLPEVRVTLSGGYDSFARVAAPNDNLLGGLLSPDFDEQTCLSRYQSTHYRKASLHALSSYLVSKLRNYEALHKRCNPNTPLYKKSVENLKSNHSIELECNYVIWSPMEGLGNRMLSLASTFLYALLTNKVLLVHQTGDLVDLFCEPFPGSTWILPSDFPIKDLNKFNLHSQQSYGNMLGKNLINYDIKAPVTALPAFVYIHLQHDYKTHLDRLFFCEDDQLVLKKVNWLLLRSDNYFVPGLFMIPQYEDELRRLFLIKETAFHHLGRYLYHPSNTVWGMIMRYHESYLSKADERVGMQIRTFSWAPISSENLLNQFITCSQQEKLLPEINLNESQSLAIEAMSSTKSLLVVSLHHEYYEKLKDRYYEHSTTTGETVSVYQPTHEGHQHSDKQSHNHKALAEICLLSFSDVLITTAASTFGYVSNSLAGLKPWIVLSPANQKMPDPPYRRAMSMDPCFHAPPNFNCKAKKNADSGILVRHVKHCEDFKEGVKLVD